MSRFISMVIAVFALLTIATCAQAQVGICAPSNAVGESGIGDGCSVPGWAPYTFPTVGAFEGTFTQSCNWHDKCYTSIGTSYSECNGNFLSDMKGACANNYPVYLLPDVYSTCIATANMYYAAVVYYANTYDPLPGLQRDALNRSRTMENDLRLNHCAPTSIAATTLFDTSLINLVNSTWQTYAHRAPTVYEFFDAVDGTNGNPNANTYPGPSIVDDRADWNTYLIQRAVAAAGFIPPVVNTPTRQAMALAANPNVAGVTYLWDMNGGQTIAASDSFPSYDPKYNTTYTASGFLSAISSPYRFTLPVVDATLLAIPPGARNAVTFNLTYTETGWCGPSPKQYCE